MAGLYYDFLAHLRGTGVSKTSHFQVFIPFLSPGLQQLGRSLSLRCEATDLPGRQLVTQDNRIYGPSYKTPYQSVFQEITLNFLENQNMDIRKFFEVWMDIIFDSASNKLEYPNTYRFDISITQFDISPTEEDAVDTAAKPNSSGLNAVTLAPLLTWHLIAAFPTAINQMPVSWTEDGFHRVSVTMAYEYYLLSDPSQPKKQIKPEGSTSKKKNGSAK